MRPWHSMGAGEVLSALESDGRRGLTEEEAASRLARYGPNALAKGQRASWPRRLLDQLRDPMILVLLAAAVLSLGASGGEDWLDAAIILLIVVVNACISLSQEDSAEKALAALQQLSAPLARVIRDGKEERIPPEGLTPGDLIRLEAGDQIPADARLIESAGLRCDESAMTGESAPVSKEWEVVLAAEAPLAERKNMVLSGTAVTAGRGVCVVTATGMESEMGRIAGLLQDQSGGETPLQKKMGEVSRTLSFLCLCVCAVMFGVGLLFHYDLLTMFMTAVSLAVAAIPEGLPAIVTIVLSLGVGRLARRKAIVKRLPAVETLGCAGVICSDKTGTLTQNKMTVTQVWLLRQEDRETLRTAAALCTDVRIEYGPGGKRRCTGDPTETALVELALSEGVDKHQLEEQWPRRGELPFDSSRKRMSTIHLRPGGGFRVMVKGAPDVLLTCCTVDEVSRRRILDANAAMADKALRVLGIAYRDLAFLPRTLDTDTIERGLTFVGLVGMIDPPRPEVRQAVEACYTAGIRPVMITGDHRRTAVAVARETGIFRQGDLSLTGADLDFMPQELLEEEVERFSVYARVTPEHKMRIVQAWQKREKVVAMTGDGVNDAPALKASDIGCAMGRSGTDVARGAADMILTDDNFATIVSAVEEGRGIYANIRKAIHYLLSCNIGEILTVFVATLFHFPQLPLVPVQLLWLNLVTDSLPALALGVEPVEPGVMGQQPRDAHKPLFDRAFSLRLAWQGVMVGLLTLGAYFLGAFVLGEGATAWATANTMAFATLTFCQLFHAFNVRGENRSLLTIGLTSNPAMLRAFAVGVLMQLAVLCLPPLQTVFQTIPLTPPQWWTVLGLAIAPIPICQLPYFLSRKKAGKESFHPALPSPKA